MSCTFWIRRKKKAAQRLEQARLQAKATIPKEEEVAKIPEAEAPKKPTKKAVAKNDNTATV